MIIPMIPVQPNTQTTIIPLDAFPGQKAERSQDNMLRRVVGRRRETSAAKEEVPREQVERAAGKLNRLMGIIGKNWEFMFEDGDDGKVVIRIIDKENGEKLGDITPQRLMEILASFNEAAGLFFDEQV